jgi:aromatic-L-amino-acid decarboxylase
MLEVTMADENAGREGETPLRARPSTGDMDAETFRREGFRLVRWIASYMENADRYPVLSKAKPGDVRNSLPSAAPRAGEDFDAILEDFEKLILPGITHWNHPGFFAYFAISGSGPGVLGEFLSAALNAQGMLWRTSPSVTELEEVALGWLRDLMGIPKAFEGVIYDTASVSSMHALAAAREVLVPRVRSEGLAGRADLPRYRVYCSEQAHSSIDKAAILIGLGHGSLRKIPTDPEFRMLPEALADAIAEDRRAGIVPLAVVATVGTTSTTSVDPVESIAAICEREGAWLHVDSAYAGVAAIIPEYRHILHGIERADSVVVNPHKWLFTPFDLSAFYCRRMDVVRSAFSLTPEYLRTTDPAAVRNLMDTGIQLGRRFRALKLWMILRYFGADGIRSRLSEHIRLARLFAAWVDEDPDFERLAPVPFGVVCFRARPSGGGASEADLEALNEALLEAMNATGEVFLSHTKLDGRYTLRLAVGNLKTTERHVRRAWEIARSELSRLSAPAGSRGR